MSKILNEMVGPPYPEEVDKPKASVKVMILNTGNMPMFLNMMCSARRAVRPYRYGQVHKDAHACTHART